MNRIIVLKKTPRRKKPGEENERSRSFFVDKKITIEKCLQVSKVESKADKISTELKNIIFSNKENGLATKVHLRYFVEIMDEVANLSEDVADRLIISSSKN